MKQKKTPEDHYVHQITFRSKNHTVYTVDQCKVGLKRYDDKRWILQDGVTTRPHGHYLGQSKTETPPSCKVLSYWEFYRISGALNINKYREKVINHEIDLYDNMEYPD